MGWNTISAESMVSTSDKAITDGQRRAIRSLQAQLDGVHVDDYEQHDLPEMSRLQASQLVNALKTKLESRRKKS